MSPEALSWRIDSLWFEIAIISSLTAVGSIVLGHFEVGAPKWRRVLKLVTINLVAASLSATVGRIWTFGLLGLMFLAVLVIHL